MADPTIRIVIDDTKTGSYGGAPSAPRYTSGPPPEPFGPPKTLKAVGDDLEQARLALEAMVNPEVIDALKKLQVLTAELVDIPKLPLPDMVEETNAFARSLFELNAAMDPDVVHQRVAQELELADARKSLKEAMDAERKKQKPEGLMDKIGGMDPLLSVLGTAGIPGMGGIGKIAGGIAGGNPLAIVAGAMELLKDFRDAIVGAVRAVGQFTVSLVQPSNDPSQFIQAMGNAAKTVGDKLLYIVPPIAIFASVIGEAVSAVAEFMRAMDGMVERYAKYSPGLAAAKAQADVGQIINDIRRAQEVTPTLLRYLAVRYELQQKFEDAKIKFLTALMPLAIKGMELGEKLLPFVEVIINILLGIANLLGATSENVDSMRKRQEAEEIKKLMESLDVMNVVKSFASGPFTGGGGTAVAPGTNIPTAPSPFI